MESLKELYRIGPGPSSSHTLAVRNACLYYLNQFPNALKYSVVLCGSLAFTGRGHMTDKIIEKEFGQDNVVIRFNDDYYDEHPNTMIFNTLNGDKKENEMIIYSIGGGKIEVKGMDDLVNPYVYPQQHLKDIQRYCTQMNCSLADYVFHFEPEIKDYLKTVAVTMIDVIDAGLVKEGFLPGSLHLKKVAHEVYLKSLECEDEPSSQKLLITSYAYAAMEENACGGMVVTAPTLGSCGIVSAMVHYYADREMEIDRIAEGLAVAGIIGNIIKTNATISGAAGGCQAEVGTACAMAAAMSAYMENLSNRQIEIAAEIAMEHNLGLTCDPVGGYVQVPCIERNGVGVLRSLDAMLYAKYLGPIKESKVSFDMIVSTMNYTGKKIAMELRETSLGGLANVVPLGNDE